MNGWKRPITAAVTVVVIAALAIGCESTSDRNELVLLTHESFALSDETLATFTSETGIDVVVETAGDAGSMVNQAILTKDNPIADVLYGVDTTFLSRAIDEGIFIPHVAVGIDDVDASFRIDGDVATPIDYGDVCINYDIAALEGLGVPPPSTIADLTADPYRDLLVVENPATSSPGLAFLLATIAIYPEGTSYDWRAYWQDLFANGVSISSDWTDAYSNQFSASGGSRPLVVSYASSPPAEVLFGNLGAAPTAVMTDGCFRQIEYAGVLDGTPHRAEAGKLVDFLLSRKVQEDIPLNMFVYPVNPDAQLPDVFETYTAFPEAPITMAPEMIDQNRERWIEEWTTLARS